MNLYATPGMVKEQIDKKSTLDDTHLLRVLISASRLIDEAAGRTFYPKRQALTLDPSPGAAWPGTAAELWLPQPLLAAESVQFSADYGRTFPYTLTATEYWLSDGAVEVTPFQLLTLDPYGAYPSFYAGPRSVQVTGVWGYRRDYAGAWAAVDTVQNNPLTVGATSLTVDDVSGADELGFMPRFAVGQLLRIGSEFLAVVGANAEADVLTVRRAQNGTTAAQHAQGAAIEVWRPEPIVVQATVTQAARTFKRGLAGFEDASANVELGQVMYVKRLDPDVQVMLYDAGLRRVTI
jgi:hypothetical protein